MEPAMFRRPKITWSVIGSLLLLGVLLGLLPVQLAAQDDPVPLPTAGFSNSAGEGIVTTQETTSEDGASFSTNPDDAGFVVEPVVVVNDDFENGLENWLGNRELRTVSAEEGNNVAQLADGDSLALVLPSPLSEFEATVWFNLAEGETNTLNVLFGSNYHLKLNAQETILQTIGAEAPLVSDDAAVTVGNWQRLDLALRSNTVTVKVNDAEVLQYTPTSGAPALIAMTPFTLLSTGGNLRIDDVRVVDYRPAQLIILPETSASGTTASLVFEATKVGADLRNLIETYNSQDAASVQALGSTYALTLDKQGRITVEIWAAEGISGETLADLMLAHEGKVETIDFHRIVARVDLTAIAALSLSEYVSVINSVPRLTASEEILETAAAFSSTEGLAALPLNVANVASDAGAQADQSEVRSPVGSAVTTGYDITGVQSWHNAGFQGNGVGIALFDVGFGSPTDAGNADTACAADDSLALSFGTRAAGDSRRGLNMLQVICDVAPASQVRLYKAQTMDQLYDAMVAATSQPNRIFVIGHDFGPNVAPGDGTLGYASAKNPYTVLQNARAAGIILLTAAGNSRQAYTAFNYTGTATTATFSVQPGVAINIGWNDWDSAPNGSSPREDFNVSMTGAGISPQGKPARGTSNPGYQFVVPTNCPATAGFCTVSINLAGLTGNASVVQIQASGASSTLTNLTGSTAFSIFGTITRPGDSSNAITIGAVCASPRLNYPVMNYSSRGPVYNAGGNAITTPPPAYYTGNQVKPDLVAPAQVSTTFGIVSNPESCGQGFGGTQAGLAHVAGQVAVLLSNPANPSFQTTAAYNNILRYLRSHGFDQPAAPALVGYDMLHGAGVPVLGAANFSQDNLPNIGTITFPNRIPADACTTGTIYVGPYNVGAANMDGTITRPFNSLMQGMALAAQGTNSCVIALPGEYSSPVYALGFANKVSVYAYSGVVNTLAQPSRLHIQNGFTKDIGGFNHSGGLFVDGTSMLWSGFTFTKGAFFNNASLPEPSALVVNAATDVDFVGNTLQGLTTRQIYHLIEVLNGSNNVSISSNSFINNIPAFTLVTDPDTGQQVPSYLGSMNLVVVEGSGTPAAGQRITLAYNRFQGNKNASGVWILDGLPTDGAAPTIRQMDWVALVRSVDSYTDVVSNTFSANEAETLLAGVTRLKAGAQEMRVLGNAIVNNTMRAYDGFPSGPLIHYFFMPHVMVLNNTFARNNANASGGFSMIVGRGDSDPNNYFESSNNNNSGSLGSDNTTWEFHNNFLVDNVVDTVDTTTGQIVNTDLSIGQVINDLEAPGVQCKNFAGTANQGAYNNWLYRAAQTPGVCGPAFQSNNTILTDPYPRNAQYVPVQGAVTYIIGGAPAARFNPAYYALVGASNGVAANDGIDEGLDTFVVNNLPEFANGLDARGVNRRNNGDNTPAIAIDIGAYEYTPLQLVGNLNATTNEDTGIISFVLGDEYLSGGFPPYTINVLRSPKYFGVAGVDGALCDARFTAAAKGVVSGALPDGTPVLLYCPPKDFHTAITDPVFQPSNAGFDFRVTDSGNRAANSTIRYTIAPVNDAPLSTVLGNSAPSGDIVDAPVAIGRPANQNFFRLRPYIDLSNGFFFSERNNALEPSARTQVDYMFTYGTPTLLGDAGNDDPQVVVNNLVPLDALRGVYGVNLSNVSSVPGGYAQAKLRYSVTDRNGHSVNNIVTVRVLTPPTGFTLTFPGNNTVFVSRDEVTTFRWTEAGNTQNYRFTVSKITGGTEQVLINLPNLSPTSGNDQLNCASGTCTLTLTPGQTSVLSTGEFKWTAIANNQGLTTTASNAPFFFSIATGTQLVQNGSFELASSNKKIADNWKPKNTDDDKRICNKPEKGKFFSLAGSCAYRFKGKSGVNSAIIQKIPQFGTPNDRVVFSFFARGDELKGGASAFIKVKYIDDTKAKVPIDVSPGTSSYTPYSESLDLTNVAKNAKIKFKMDGGKGKFYIDVVSALLYVR
jgi:hypothetical protein